MNGLTVGSLFSGIGGFDLGFERAGMRTVWFCEQDPFCQRVLAKHWPGVPCFPDVRALVADTARVREARIQAATGADRQRAGAGDQPGGAGGAVPVPVPYVDVLCGGFPCQDLSLAGKGAGLDGARSGLWSEFARLIGDLRPRYVVVENVPALLSRGGDRVLADLAACGFDAEWDCLPASAFGAPHRRDRLWLVAYPNADHEGRGILAEHDGGAHELGGSPPWGHADRFRNEVADADSGGRDGWAGELRPVGWGQPSDGGGESAGAGASHSWITEPDVGRVANGVPARVDRLRSLGNSLVPQIAEFIGRQIVSYENARTRPDHAGAQTTSPQPEAA